MENFEWQDKDVESSYNMFQRMLNKTVKNKFEIIKGVEVDPVSFQIAYFSMSYYKNYKVKLYIDSSFRDVMTEDMLDVVEHKFNEMFDTLIKVIAPPVNKKKFTVMINADVKLV